MDSLLLTVNEVLNEQEDLEALCQDRPIITPELFDGNSFYGNAEILKYYADLPADYSIKATIPHGYYKYQKKFWPAEVHFPLTSAFCFTEDHLRDYRIELEKHALRKKLYLIAYPFLYLIEVLQKAGYCQTHRQRKGTIFFPIHSTHHVQASMDRETLADELMQLPEIYHPVTICMYWRDLHLGNHLPFQARGFKLVSAGHIFDPRFMTRFYHLCTLHQYAASNSWGSAVLYAVSAGCSYFHFERVKAALVANSKILDQDIALPPQFLLAKLTSLFQNPTPAITQQQQESITQQQQEFADRMLGRAYLYTPNQLRHILLDAQILFDQCQIQGTKHFISKLKSPDAPDKKWEQLCGHPLYPIILEAVNDLNRGDNLKALETLKKLDRSKIPTVQYLRTIVKARLGYYLEAAQILESLLVIYSTHVKTQKLFQEIKEQTQTDKIPGSSASTENLIRTITILHVIERLSDGGAARSMIATAKYSSALQSCFKHQIISLLPAEADVMQQAESTGVVVINAPGREELLATIKQADVVHVHFWNNPHIYNFLRSELPPMRLLIWFHVAGDKPPHIITKPLVEYSDYLIPCNPYSYQLPVFKPLELSTGETKLSMVYDGTDFERIRDVKTRSHPKFNVGYIGTVDFVKMHPHYVSMSASVDIPEIRFVVCGGGISDVLREQARQLGVQEKFEFKGYVEDITSVLEILDVYGYPLCEDTYAAAELNLQEVMYCGIPPVVFPYGGVKSLIQHNETGLIVNTEQEYKAAIEYLYHYPEERRRLGENARQYALRVFGAENGAKAINPIYEKLIQQSKRERFWGIPVGERIIDQDITIPDLLGSEPSGAEKFIESLGNAAPQFLISMRSSNIEALFEADRQIAQSSSLLRSPGSGGILCYRNYYPHDPYLCFWSGLVNQHLNQHQVAIDEFSDASRLGFSHWRILWYIAQSAAQIKNYPLAQQALRGVFHHYPNFTPAQELASSLTSLPSPAEPALPNANYTNIIALPDWTQDEDTTYTNFYPLLQWFLKNQTENLHLWVDIENADPESANLLVVAILSELSMTEDLDLEYEDNLHLIDTLGHWTLDRLGDCMIQRFPLAHENQKRAKVFPGISLNLTV